MNDASSQEESLFQLLRNSIALDPEIQKDLKAAKEHGNSFFHDFNENRMKLAFSCFSDDMKKALYEVIFFLHVNEPHYAKHTYTSIKKERVNGVLQEIETEEEVNLYVKGATSGVVGISRLSSIFEEDFQKYIQKELNGKVSENKEFAPIYSIASLGSIGTVGHKTLKSDLDLQVQYELEPFLINTDQISNQDLKNYLHKLIQFYAKRFARKKKWSLDDFKELANRIEASQAGRKTVQKRFPVLFAILTAKELSLSQAIKKTLKDRKKKQRVVHECIDIVKLYNSIFLKKEREQKEKLLKDRILKIQDYVQKKYPNAEIYLFAYSNDDYRQGKHGTTLESKESSGSAYELILNYDVLMPGIQFSPMIPTHFLMPDSVNKSVKYYGRIIDYIRFGLLDLYDEYKQVFVDLGATPPLSIEYMTAHAGAVYWESFKASSGNLPKALLNLFRLEMLFDPKFPGTVIEIVKDPHRLDHLLDKELSEEEDDLGLLEESDKPEGMPLFEFKNLEKKFSLLLKDPWWIRYKLLKIGFSYHNERIQDKEEIRRIQCIIDICFALHVRISVIFGQAGAKKEEDKTYREQVLTAYWERAFPPLSPQRKYVEHIFIGEVKSINTFEKELKELFKNSLNRVNAIVDQQPTDDKTNQEEFLIWYNYYLQNFEPPSHAVEKAILTDLKVPRGRLQMGFKDKKWFFRSLQKESGVGKRFDAFGVLNHLPDEVDLFAHKSFLHGIAHCVLNGYYGILNRGTLKESKTAIEFDIAHMKLATKASSDYAYIRPDNVERLIAKIDEAFPYQPYDYRDCIRKEKEVTNIFFFLNLLRYGSISVLYRDNLRNWYETTFYHNALEKNARKFYDSPHVFLKLPLLNKTISKFLDEHFAPLTEEKESQLHFWFNPNSARTSHGPRQIAKKEEDISNDFKKIALAYYHKEKGNSP